MASMDDRTLLGVLVPSSNTRLEPLTAEILRNLPGVSAHFSRFRVVDVGLSAAHQFDRGPILQAADLLADARVESIVWSGTSGGWRGVDDDRELCADIQQRTGIPATTSTIALLEAMSRLHTTRLGLVTPYPDDMHGAVIDTLTREGIDVVGDANDPFTASNWELSLMPPETVERLVSDAATSRPDALTVFCTNIPAAPSAADWESRYGTVILDSVSLAVWHALDLSAHAGPRPSGWGRLFDL
jgi:maleate isomerase